MDTKFDLATIGQNIVYVKPISVQDLPADMQSKVGDLENVFAVHNAAGEQLALVANRELAFDLARQNQMNPVTLH